MKRGVAALAVIAVALLLWRFVDSEPQPSDKPAPTVSSPVDQPAPTLHREVRPSIPFPAALLAPDSETEERPRVEFNLDLEWNPKKELRNVYEGKAKIAKAFERFRDESGISDAKAQDILWLLHDFRETEKLLERELWSHRPFKTDAHFEFWLRKKSHAWRLLVMDMEETLERMMTPGEWRVWCDTVHQESPWNNLGWWFTEPVVVPERTP